MSSPPPMQVEVEVSEESMEDDSADMLPADKFTQPARADEAVELWKSKLDEGVLSPSHFQDYWRVIVPRVYSPKINRTCLDWSFNEELATRLLITPLEQFVWGGERQEAPARRSTLCGRVFKNGEPVYCCRECGMDNTCVLCVECFKVSAHRHHKYKICQSGGGGCCDCGDTEAWKRDAFCEKHAAPIDDSEQQECSQSPEVVKRMKIVASVCLSYCFRLLTQNHAPGLPNDLRLKDAERDPLQILDQPDCYCTVLYNDETHTFEQVITTLTRVMKCNHRDAVELVSLIDREGRALVKCTSFQHADKLKMDIEHGDYMIERFTSRHGPSLKVLVMHAHLIAHQTYAIKLLNWLQNFVSQEPSLRLAVSQVALGEDSFVPGSPGAGIAAGVMQNDWRMWKAARTAWHRLLIATTLMDYETKKTMAQLFTKNYSSMLKDFIRDDHEHSFSISSLSVQLYTTPTLAHHLIEKQDALFIALNTFVSECNRRINAKGRLEFDRNHVSMAFKRAQYVLYDVKYLLSAVPTTFTEELRRGFLHGLSLMLTLLSMMQGMDSVVRQVGQHMEYEPEWESAFNLHVKLAHSISLALAWCAADTVLANNAARMALRRLHDTEKFEHFLVKELGNKSASVIVYDVSSQPVSIHRPLSRFVAGLHLLLDPTIELDRTTTPQPHELIEPVLRTMAMISGVHAGMWRRNGFALLNQLFFYHNVKCRSEMLDRDVLMLQIGASLIESNEFLIHVLNKYNLLEWASPDFEQTPIEDDTLRHTISMVEEFLGLLITVVGSRYVPGVGEVTQEDRTKKEIIQMLCVKPMPHSELNRSLPEDQLHETGLEAVIHEVADFSKPTSGNNHGVYTLKSHLYEEYDTFFYHYTREKLSRSEETQRNRRKAAGLPECCPPPPLPKLTSKFRLLANLLQCESAILIIKTVLERALDLRARSFSETQVHKTLHLIGYALRDEASGHYEFLAFAETAQRAGVLTLLQRLAVSPRVDAHAALAHWLLAKMRSLLGHTEEGSGDAESMETDQSEKPSSEEVADQEKARRAKMAAERRAKLLAQMQAAQNKFISNNKTLFSTTSTETAVEEQSPRPDQCSGAKGEGGPPTIQDTRVCIMCQEEAPVEVSDDPLVLVAFAQCSRVLGGRLLPPGGQGVTSTAEEETEAALPAGVGAAPHVSSCGHALHASCWRKYVDNVVDKENRRPYRLRQPAAFDVLKQEYLCPLCERLCNTALPLLPPPPPPSSSDQPPPPPPPLSDELYAAAVQVILAHQVSSSAVHVCSEQCEEMHCRARTTGDGVAAADQDVESESAEEAAEYVSTACRELLPSAFLQHLESSPPPSCAAVDKLIDDFAKILPGVCSMETSSLLSRVAALYRCTSYTLMCMETLLRAERRPLLGELAARHAAAPRALLRVAGTLPVLPRLRLPLGHHAVRALVRLERCSPLEGPRAALLVPLVLASPALLSKRAAPARPTPLTRRLTLQVFRSALTAALLTLDPAPCRRPSPSPPPPPLAHLLPLLAELHNGTLDIQTLDATEVWQQVQRQCRGFLRCSCLMFYLMSDASPPEELTVVDGDTWDSMCRYLRLPTTFDELLGTQQARAKALEWAALSGEWFKGNIPRELVVEPEEPPKLIPLPEDFSELMNMVSDFSCPNSEREDSKYPTMCLICGEILCSQSYCCQIEIKKSGRSAGAGAGAGGAGSAGETEHVGAAVGHALTCGAGAGVFLRVRDCEVLLLGAPARGAALEAPYLDHYGETDQGLRRGNPLRLCPELYESLRMLWLSHGVHERIARVLDTNMLVNTRWQTM